jgi:porphobilinogen deaminase
LRGVVITDLNDVQVRAMDALLLAEKGYDRVGKMVGTLLVDLYKAQKE